MSQRASTKGLKQRNSFYTKPLRLQRSRRHSCAGLCVNLCKTSGAESYNFPRSGCCHLRAAHSDGSDSAVWGPAKVFHKPLDDTVCRTPLSCQDPSHHPVRLSMRCAFPSASTHNPMRPCYKGSCDFHTNPQPLLALLFFSRSLEQKKREEERALFHSLHRATCRSHGCGRICGIGESGGFLS